MRVIVDSAGDMEFRDLPPLCAESLLQLPETLRSDDPAVRERLMPDAYEDGEALEDWKRFAVPQLEHLFAGRIETVEQDLKSLRKETEFEFAIDIPARHRSAWLSALNAARLTMFMDAGLEAEDIDEEPGDLADHEQNIALLRIHLLAFMQELMLEAAGEG